jgi:DNA polymerase-1
MNLQELVLPNVKKLFIPDLGKMIFDCDLKGADAQVVAWEAGDTDLKDAFRRGEDIHVKNATDMSGPAFTSLKPDSPAWKKIRQDNKRGVHATNYGTSAKTIAATLGWTIHEAETFIRRWFAIHPKIRKWQERVQQELEKTKSVTNAFGFRRTYYDRIDQLLPQALAWGPQSTVGLVAMMAANNLDQEFFEPGHIKNPLYLKWVEMLIQVHDSIVFQTPMELVNNHRLREIKKALTIIIPYDDPLIIPFSLSYSPKSWGDCEKHEWPPELLAA